MALRSPGSMKGNRKPVTFITDLLDHLQDRRAPVEDHGLILSARNVENLLAFGDTGQWLIDDIQRIQGCLGRMQLADPPVNQDQARHLSPFLLDSLVPPRYHLTHALKVSRPPGNLTNDDAALVG